MGKHNEYCEIETIRRGLIRYEVDTDLEGTELVTIVVVEGKELVPRLERGKVKCNVYVQWEGLVEHAYGLQTALEETMEIAETTLISGYFDPFIRKVLNQEHIEAQLPGRILRTDELAKFRS